MNTVELACSDCVSTLRLTCLAGCFVVVTGVGKYEAGLQSE